MAKKIIILALVFIVLGLVAWFLFSRSGISNNAADSDTNLGSGTTSPAALLTPTIINFPDAPQSNSFAMGTPKGSVTMNNFFKLPVVQDQEFLILENTNDYQITYDTVSGQFFIYASSSPLDVARVEGESAFLTLLGVSEGDACKLNVAEGYPAGASLTNSSSGLSFCASGAFGQ